MDNNPNYQQPNPLDLLKQQLKQSFKDGFPCTPEFFKWHSTMVDLGKVDAKVLAKEINKYLVKNAKDGKLFQLDVPLHFQSKVAKGDIEVTLRVQAVQALQDEVIKLIKHPQIRIKANPNGHMTESNLLAFTRYVLIFIKAGTSVLVPYSFYKNSEKPTLEELRQCANNIQLEIFPPVTRGRPASEAINDKDIPLLLVRAIVCFKKRIDTIYAIQPLTTAITTEELSKMGTDIVNFIRTGIQALAQYKFILENIVPKQQDIDLLVSNINQEIFQPVQGNKSTNSNLNERDFEMLLARAITVLSQRLNEIVKKKK